MWVTRRIAGAPFKLESAGWVRIDTGYRHTICVTRQMLLVAKAAHYCQDERAIEAGRVEVGMSSVAGELKVLIDTYVTRGAFAGVSCFVGSLRQVEAPPSRS